MLLGFAIMVAYLPNIVGAVVPTGWAAMWIIAPIYLLKCKIEITLIHILGLIFLTYASLSLIWSPHGYYALMQILALASVFVWGASLIDLKKVVIGLSVGLCISALISILNIPVYRVTDKFAGLFVNSNIFAEVSGMLLILILIYKLWWYIPVVIPGLLVSSRAVVIGLGISLALMAWTKSKLLSVIILIGSWLTAWLMTFSVSINITSDNIANGTIFYSNPERIASISERISIWKDMLLGLTIFGHGVGSYQYEYPLYAKHMNVLIDRPIEAHNDILQLIFEFGIGLIPLAIIVISLLKVNDDHRFALLFFGIIGLFGFPLHVPATAFMVAVVAGYLASRSLAVRKSSNNWGLSLFKGLAAT